MYASLRNRPADPAGSVGDSSTRSSRKARVAAPVFFLGLTSLFTDISSELVATVLPLYLTLALGLSPLAFGFIDGIYQGVTALVRIGGGFVADHTRRPKAVAVAGYAASAIAKLALLPAATFATVASVIAVDRIGKGIRTAPRDALIAASSSSTGLGRSFGVHRAMDTLGAMLGPLLAFAMLAAIPGGYDAIFVASFCFALMGLAVLVLMVPNLRPPAREESSKSPKRASAQLLSVRSYRQTLVAAGLLALVTVGDGFLFLVIQQRTDLSPKYFPLLFVGSASTYLLLAVPLGRLADRVGRRHVFIAGHVALLGAYAAAGSGVSAIAAVVLCLALLGTYYAATDGVLSALTVPMVPEALRSSGLAGVQTVVALGRFAAAIGFGAIWTMASVDTALVVYGIALALALVPAFLFLRDTREAAG